MAYQDGRAKRAAWNHEQRAAFINAIREVLGKEPIPYSRGMVEHYSGMTIYGASSKRTTAGSASGTSYEPLS